MYVVYDNGKKADSNSYPELKGYGWDNAEFATLLEAQEYADNWLGAFAPGRFLELNEEYEIYSNSAIVIREE